MTQQKIDDLFNQRLSTKRSRIINNERDEFDDLFETNNSIKRSRTSHNKKTTTTTTDVFDFDIPTTTKRNIHDDNENKAIDDLFNNTRKKLRRPITTDVFDMFNIPSKIDDFKTPISSKIVTTQKKLKTFFDDTDLISIREENDTKDYIQIKPVLITSGQWLSKEAETKSTCQTMKTSDNLIDIPDDERNLMHLQYASLIIDEEILNNKKKLKTNSMKQKSNKKLLDGKSFEKQLVLSDSTILRKENLQSCYNALLENLNKPRISSSNKSKILNNDEDEIDNIDFFDLSTRKKKF